MGCDNPGSYVFSSSLAPFVFPPISHCIYTRFPGFLFIFGIYIPMFLWRSIPSCHLIDGCFDPLFDFSSWCTPDTMGLSLLVISLASIMIVSVEGARGWTECDGVIYQNYVIVGPESLYYQPPNHSNLLRPYSIFAYIVVIRCASARLTNEHQLISEAAMGENASPDNIGFCHKFLQTMSTADVYTRILDGLHYEVHQLIACGGCRERV